MSFAWAKLYFDILDDPKVARLPAALWRRFIECVLLAHELGEGGRLPELSDMAWRLHCDEDELAAELQELEKRTGTVTIREGRWFVVNLMKRQGAMSDRERKARQRERTPVPAVPSAPAPDRDAPVPVAAPGMVTVRDDTDDSARHGTVTDCDTDRDKDLDLDSDPDREGEGETDPPKRAKTRGAPLRVVNPPPRPGQPVELLPAVAVIARITGKVPPVALHHEIDECVGRDPPELRRFEDVVRGWLACGWNPANVAGMLDHFERDEVPDEQARRHKQPADRAGIDGRSYITGVYADYVKH